MRFEQLLGEDDEAKDLGPFGDDVADDLSPLGVGVCAGEEEDPADAGKQQKNGERMVAELFPEGGKQRVRRIAAFSGADLVHVLGGEHGDDKAGPIGDGVTEKRAPMGTGVGVEVQDDPGNKDEAGDDAERVAMKEGAGRFAGHRSWMIQA
jgi:hypothetical protein